MDSYSSKSKTELIAEIQELKRLVNSSDANNKNTMTIHDFVQQCDDLSLINGLSSAVIQKKPFKDILSLLSRSVGKIFNSHGVAVYLLSKDNDSLEMQHHTLPVKIRIIVENLMGIKIPQVIIKRSSESFYFKAITSRKHVTINGTNDIKKLMYELTDSKVLRKYISRIQNVIGIKHIVIFPLVSGNSVLGIMDISRETAFSNFEIERLENIVSQVTTAILFYRATLEKEELLQKLQTADKNIKKLSGLIPICSNCKKIRDDSGYWNQVEKYITEHTDAVFTHGICPDCMKKLYPEYVDKIMNQKK